LPVSILFFKTLQVSIVSSIWYRYRPIPSFSLTVVTWVWCRRNFARTITCAIDDSPYYVFVLLCIVVIVVSLINRVRTCQEESNSRTIQGDSRTCISKFKD
jgi:hypothetical protein